MCTFSVRPSGHNSPKMNMENILV